MPENENEVVVMEDLIIPVPKEMNDVKKCFEKLSQDIAAKKPIAEIAAGSLINLSAAINGAQKLPTIAKQKLKESCDCGLLMGNAIIHSFLDASKEETPSA